MSLRDAFWRRLRLNARSALDGKEHIGQLDGRGAAVIVLVIHAIGVALHDGRRVLQKFLARLHFPERLFQRPAGTLDTTLTNRFFRNRNKSGVTVPFQVMLTVVTSTF